MVDGEMIDYGSFQFAAPAFSGVDWFVNACEAVGLGATSVYQAEAPFTSVDSKLRISLVRHPCSILEDCYTALVDGKPLQAWEPLSDLVTDDFESFVWDYLKYKRGFISGVFGTYQAGSVMRAEDMPWAAMEFFDSLGIEDLHPLDLPLSNYTLRPRMYWMSSLRRKVMEAEEEFCDRCEYW